MPWWITEKLNVMILSNKCTAGKIDRWFKVVIMYERKSLLNDGLVVIICESQKNCQQTATGTENLTSKPY